MGDGGLAFALEQRLERRLGGGYFMPPEVVLESDVECLHREFMESGADVLRVYGFRPPAKMNAATAAADHRCHLLNEKACQVAADVASGNGVLVAASISQSPIFLEGREPKQKGKNDTKQKCQNANNKQLDAFFSEEDSARYHPNLLIAEGHAHVEECEWAIESLVHRARAQTTAKSGERPIAVAASMCLSPSGDLDGVSVEECTKRMVAAGADIVGITTHHHDPFTSLQTMKKVRDTLAEMKLLSRENQSPERPAVHMMLQPLGFVSSSPDTGPQSRAFQTPRCLDSLEVEEYARRAHALGVRYIGGSCGFGPQHIGVLKETLTALSKVSSTPSQPEGVANATLP